MKKTAILLLSGLLLLSGCSAKTADISDQGTVLFTVGEKSLTKGNEYSFLKSSQGAEMTMELVRQSILDEEIGRNEEITAAAQSQFDTFMEGNPDFENQVIAAGYKDKQEYIDKTIIPSVQQEKLMSKYFTDAKKDIQKSFKPSVAKILECADADTAKKALEELKKGTDTQTVYDTYKSEATTYGNSDTFVSTSSNLPDRLINTLSKAKEPGVVDEVFTFEDGTSTSAYVAILTSNTYEDIMDQITANLSSEPTVTSDCFVYYLKKHKFEVHDQEVFDYLKNNYPQYLYQFPELNKTA